MNLAFIKSKFGALLQLAAWVISVIAVFVIEPPHNIIQSAANLNMTRFVQFVFAILLGLSFIVFQRFSRKKDTKLWIVVGVLCLGIGISVLFAYILALGNWTCEYDGALVVKGGTYTDVTAQFLKEHPGVSCDHLIEDAPAHQIDQIWPRAEIFSRYFIMIGLYTFAILAFGSAVLATVQALKISKAFTPHRPS
jgi:hypothetical protein